MSEVILPVCAYLIGSLPTGVAIARLFGIDVRQSGSGNIGATNVARSVGRGAGIVTLLGDVGKGIFAVWLAASFAAHPSVAAVSGVAVVLGHVFSIFLRFSGGKGVATGLGVMIMLAPEAVPAAVLGFGIAFAVTRIVSVASLAGAWAAPASMVLLGSDTQALIVLVLLGGLITIRHQENIQRLRAGAEARFGGRDTARRT